METTKSGATRREFLRAAGRMAAGGLMAGGAIEGLRAAEAPEAGGRIALGVDNFSIRAFGWKAPRLIDLAASQKLDVLLISDLDSFESLEEAPLRELRARAADRGLELQVGTGSICPTSRSYDAKKRGPAEDHLRLLVRTARALGSRVARCYVGNGGDREGGIERHIEAAVKVIRAVRSEAADAGVKIAVENHAGDMQAWELAGLLDEAGKEYVGATMDTGNSVWTLEDPAASLEVLGPYAVTTGMRDSAVWESERGATALWTNMGRGTVDWKAYLARYRQLCPGVPFVLEVCSYVWPREIAYLETKIWENFPKARAREFARFVALAKRGVKTVAPEARPSGSPTRELEQAQQMWDLEDSIKYCREALGLGRR